MEKERCSKHNKDFKLFCVRKGCENNQLCIDCVQHHSQEHIGFLNSYDNLTKITNEMIEKNQNIEDIKDSLSKKDQCLLINTPEIIKKLKETFNKFIESVEKAIKDSSNSLFVDGSLLYQNTDETNDTPEKLIKKFHFINEILLQKEIIQSIQIKLEIWTQNCQNMMQKLSQYLEESIENFKIKPLNIKIDSHILQNVKDISIFHNILQQNQSLKINNYSLIYRATLDGDTCKDLYSKTEKKVPLCFLIKVHETGLIYGVFTSVQYASNTSGHYEDKDAFIFSVSKNRVFKVKDIQQACYCSKTCLLGFGGGGDIGIKNNCLTNNTNFNNLGFHYYGVDENWKSTQNKTFLAGIEKYKVEELECFHLIG